MIPHIDEIANEQRNAFPFNVPANENRIVWVEVHVPKGQAPGTYQGSLSVTGSGLGTMNVPITLTVWDFELPSTSSLASTFGMGWNAACVAHYGSYEACGGDAGVESTHLLYARFMLDHRMTAEVIYTGPSDCVGSACDWSHFDATYGPLFDGTDSTVALDRSASDGHPVHLVGDTRPLRGVGSALPGEGMVRSHLRLHVRRTARRLQLERHRGARIGRARRGL